MVLLMGQYSHHYMELHLGFNIRRHRKSDTTETNDWETEWVYWAAFHSSSIYIFRDARTVGVWCCWLWGFGTTSEFAEVFFVLILTTVMNLKFEEFSFRKALDILILFWSYVPAILIHIQVYGGVGSVLLDVKVGIQERNYIKPHESTMDLDHTFQLCHWGKGFISEICSLHELFTWHLISSR